MRRHNFVRVLTPLWLFVLSFSAASNASQNESSLTLRSALAVREAFEKTEPVSKDSGTLKVPAIVSEKLFARFFSISKATYPLGDDPAWVKKQFALGRQGIGRYFIFVGDHTLIEKALISGQYNPNEIMANVGYGPGATCSSSQNYWLVVFRPKSQAVSAVYQQNLQKWFNHVYGASHAPSVSRDVLDTLVSNRFASVTECPLDPVTGAFQWSNLDRCSPLFAKTVTALNDKQCGNPNALTYSPSNQCPTDKVLQSLGPTPSAIALRAWLFAASSFSEFYTGNGYASNFYNSPANREYWVDNVWLQKLPEVELLKIQCPANTPNIGFAQGTSMNPIVSKPFGSLVEEY